MKSHWIDTDVTYEKHGVNGRSGLDIANARLLSLSGSHRPHWIGVPLLVIDLFVHAATHLLPDGFGATLIGTLSPLLIPALWGGVGA